MTPPDLFPLDAAPQETSIAGSNGVNRMGRKLILIFGDLLCRVDLEFSLVDKLGRVPTRDHAVGAIHSNAYGV